MLRLILLVIISYLMGAIPVAYIYCKFRGKDITKEGSGNVGATNAARLYGKSAFFTIFILDALKGFIPIFFISPILCPVGMNIQIVNIIVLFVTVSGHIWSVFIKFKGGKGVATSLGCLLAIMPLPCILAAIIFGIIFGITRIVSIGSICASMSLPLFSWIIDPNSIYSKFSIILCFLIIYTHRSNIIRLIQGSEKNMALK